MRRIFNTILFALCCAAMESGTGAAQEFQVVKLDTLGGTLGGANSINNRGWVIGTSRVSGNTTVHATLWLDGQPIDLGTLGGPNSAVGWPVKSENGAIVGISEIASPDPLGARFSCPSFFLGSPLTGRSCQGFRWEDDVMTPLDTLGGHNSYAAGTNNRGQIVGWAEKAIQDPTCVHPRQFLQFRAVIWGPKDGEIQELPPLPGDPTSSATAINDWGQVVGISGICDRAVGRFSALHAVIWENGVPQDVIGNFGGKAWHTPTAINNLGQVVGFSDFPGDEINGFFNGHAFLWIPGSPLQDLGTLPPDDTLSLAFGINSKGQIVGQSIGPDGSRAFLWENGVMTDLNDLVPPGSPHLDYANDINDRGEIAGGATDPITGQGFGFLLIPTPGAANNGTATSQARTTALSAVKPSVPEHVRKMLLQRWGIELSTTQ